MEFLIAVSIFCCVIKSRTKQKIYYHFTTPILNLKNRIIIIKYYKNGKWWWIKEIDSKNPTCDFFYGIIENWDFDFDEILIDKKSYKNTLFGSKSLPVRFDEVDWFITVYDGIRYLLLFGSVKYDAIYKRGRYLISQKSGITFVFSYKYAN